SRSRSSRGTRAQPSGSSAAAEERPMSRLTVFCFAALAAAAPADPWLTVEGGTLFDGTGAVRPEAVVLVPDHRIAEVGPQGQVRIPPGARRIDARGRFILPGFVDAHFHFNIKTDPQVSPWLPLYFLAHGVTTVREMGNWIEAENRSWQADMAAR